MRNGGYNNAHLSAQITTPKLDGASVSGASRCRLLRIDNPAEQFEMRVSGASNIDAEIICHQLLLNVDGASGARLRGKADSLEITTGGASTVHARELVSNTAGANISGASHAEVFVTSALDYSVSGASHLSYGGNPTVRRGDSSGASSAGPQYDVPGKAEEEI